MSKKEYYVGVTIGNCFSVFANSEEEAIAIVEQYDTYSLCDESDFNINYVDEVTS